MAANYMTIMSYELLLLSVSLSWSNPSSLTFTIFEFIFCYKVKLAVEMAGGGPPSANSETTNF